MAYYDYEIAFSVIVQQYWLTKTQNNITKLSITECFAWGYPQNIVVSVLWVYQNCSDFSLHSKIWFSFPFASQCWLKPIGWGLHCSQIV